MSAHALGRLLAPVIALGLAGCAEVAPRGTGEPVEPSASGDGISGTVELAPCDLLTSREQAQFDLGTGIEDESGPARACLWQASGQHSLSIGVLDELGLGGVQSTGRQEPTTVGAHDAMRYDGPLGTCSFAIGVTDTSRVDVSAIAGGDMTKACAVAKQAAELVEPKLS